ncbi:hypothetical protein C8Q77DRAFT_1069524 [Trametes polyzona]|nr:hypothetical protein C8Q77DRAFT_1069524 [Trametes polyzona]
MTRYLAYGTRTTQARRVAKGKKVTGNVASQAPQMVNQPDSGHMPSASHSKGLISTGNPGPDAAQPLKRKVPVPKRKRAQSIDTVEPNLADLPTQPERKKAKQRKGSIAKTLPPSNGPSAATTTSKTRAQADTPSGTTTVPPRFRRRGAPTPIIFNDTASSSEDRESNVNDDGEDLVDQVTSMENGDPEEDGEEPEPRDSGPLDDLTAEYHAHPC